jgi:hypothetical protein
MYLICSINFPSPAVLQPDVVGPVMVVVGDLLVAVVGSHIAVGPGDCIG